MPTQKPCDSGLYAHAGQSVVCHKGDRLSITLLTPQGSPLDRSLDTPYVMLRRADLTGCAPADRWAKGREDAGVFLHSSRGQRSDLRCGWSGKFAGILQRKIRQRVSQLRILMTVACEGNRRTPWARPPGPMG